MLLPSPFALVELSYRPDLNIVVVRWMGPSSDDEIRQVYRFVEQNAPERCRYWLLDGRRRNSSSGVVTDWIFSEFLPPAAQGLGGPLFLSYLVSPSSLPDAAEFLQQRATFDSQLPYRLHYAIQEAEATDWLLAAQRTPALSGSKERA